MKAFFKKLFCMHGKKKCWKIVGIGYDGATTVECELCGARKTKGL